MIKSELYHIFKSKKSIILLCIMFIIPFIDLWMVWEQTRYSLEDINAFGGTIPPERILNPSMASFLSGNSRGHMPQMLLVWLLPIYLLLIYSDSYVMEKQVGYHNIILNKCNRMRVFCSKLAVSFIVPFVTSLLSVGLNFLLSNIIFKGGTNFKMLDRAIDIFEEPLKMAITYPFEVYLVYILVYSIVAGGVGIICTGLSFLFPRYKLLYPCCIFLWVVQVMSPYSVINVIQPFIEYGFRFTIPAFIVFWIIVFTSITASLIYKVKYDEY